MPCQLTGDLRVMMAGGIKTASKDGKAMHAPMLAADGEKGNWKFACPRGERRHSLTR
jgi:hypothetical protein